MKYPIGNFRFINDDPIESYLDRIAKLPENLQLLVKPLNAEELNWRYRPDGWRIYELIHHIADSHLNAYARTKVAFTESGKSITPYNENAWIEIRDLGISDIDCSLDSIEILHKRWLKFLTVIPEDDLSKTYFHPSDKKQVSIREAIQLYAWHGEHHLAHINFALASKGKF